MALGELALGQGANKQHLRPAGRKWAHSGAFGHIRAHSDAFGRTIRWPLERRAPARNW